MPPIVVPDFKSVSIEIGLHNFEKPFSKLEAGVNVRARGI